MITPEIYYLKYKKISSLFNEKYIFILMAILAIPMFLIIYNIQTHLILIIPLILYAYAVYKCLKTLAVWIKKYKIKKLRQLTKEENIDSDNFQDKYNDYILNSLIEILNEHNINSKIYNTFYRDHLCNYQNTSKNIFGDNVYVSFILGSIYISTLQAMYTLPKSLDEILITLALIFALSLFIIFMIFEIKQYTDSKYNDISKLIFYTEKIFLNQEQ